MRVNIVCFFTLGLFLDIMDVDSLHTTIEKENTMKTAKVAICVCIALAGVFLAGRWSVNTSGQTVELHDRLTFPSPGLSEAHAAFIKQSCSPTLQSLQATCVTECRNKWSAATTRDVVLNGQYWATPSVCEDGCYKMFTLVGANCPVFSN
jgi:hypothetical protein